MKDDSPAGVTRMINKHERWLKEQEVRLAKIEAKKEVEVAKVGSEDWQNGRVITRIVAWAVILVVFVSGFITYCGVQPPDPKKQEIDQQKYELCMQVEKDDERCS